MTPNDIPDDERDDLDEDQIEKKKKGKKEGEGARGQQQLTVSPEAYAFLNRIGATMAQISGILSQWAHLRGDALIKAMNEFSRDVSRASSQPQVQFDGKDVSIITTLFRYLTSRDRSPNVRHNIDSTPKDGPR